MTQEPLTIQLPDKLAEALRTYAFVTETSVNEIVGAALTDYLKAHAHTGIVRTVFDKALHLHAVAFEKLEC
jgi:predicted transcriptional regulator